MALLRRIILNVRDMEKATNFWVHGLGLTVKTTTPEWSLLQSMYSLYSTRNGGKKRNFFETPPNGCPNFP